MTDARATLDLEHLRAVFDHMVDGVLIVDADGVIVGANPAAARMFPGPPGALLGAVFGFPIADRQAVVIDVLPDRHGPRMVEMRVADVAWHGAPAQLLSLRDITEQTNLLARLDHDAHVDRVTGLPNRAQLERRLAAALADARRSGGLVAVLFVDVDDFKAVNDRYGHQAGDAFLKAVGGRLKAHVRVADTVARLAGDEFVVVLAGLDDPREAEAVAAKVLEGMATPFAIDDHRIAAGASVGVAVFPSDADAAAELVRKADVAMYAAKRLGKGTYRRYDATLVLAS